MDIIADFRSNIKRQSNEAQSSADAANRMSNTQICVGQAKFSDLNYSFFNIRENYAPTFLLVHKCSNYLLYPRGGGTGEEVWSNPAKSLWAHVSAARYTARRRAVCTFWHTYTHIISKCRRPHQVSKRKCKSQKQDTLNILTVSSKTLWTSVARHFEHLDENILTP